MSAAIEVLAIRRLDGKSSVKAFVDIKLGGVTLKGCKIVQQPEQRAWLAMPSVKTDHGWQIVAEISKPLREAATDVVLAAWATWRDKPPARGADPGRRADPRQAAVDKWAAHFDERGPDEEIPF